MFCGRTHRELQLLCVRHRTLCLAFSPEDWGESVYPGRWPGLVCSHAFGAPEDIHVVAGEVLPHPVRVFPNGKIHQEPIEPRRAGIKRFSYWKIDAT